MTRRNSANTLAFFFELLRSGLWEKDIKLSQYKNYDLNVIYRFAEEQSVVGLVAAGLEHVTDFRVPQKVALSFVGNALQLEHRNLAMNKFVAKLIEKLRIEDLFVLLVKGQGIAQCYERPLWRSCGDIDLLVDKKFYEAVKSFLIPLACNKEEEVESLKHIELNIDGWIVEIHGSLRGNVLRRIDRVIDSIQEEIFAKNKYRIWHNGATEVPLPAPDEDALLVFTHIIQHFTQGGVGLRQVCDWIRLLWSYNKELNIELLRYRILEMGLMTEWQVFGALAVDYLGMPSEAMPLYSAAGKWHRKARRLMSFIMKTGNMGHNRDGSYYNRHSYIVAKSISLWRHITDAFFHFFIFPIDTIKIFAHIIKRRSRVMIHNL